MKKEDFIGKLYLGPMAGVTDLPFRLLCRECGADIVTTEMISAKGLFYGSKNTPPLLATEEGDRPVGVQLFGREPELMAGEAEKLLEQYPFDFVDINMGCPMPKIVNNGEGSALLKEPELAAEIVRVMSQRLSVPVTVKLRAGFSKGERTAPEVAKHLEDAGAAAVAIHARTREDYYQGTADWSVIREVRGAVRIPVIGNGDIRCGQDAVRMMEETGCDAVMVARGAQGNPWIFQNILSYFETGIESPKPDIETVKKMILEHARMEVETKGEYIAIREMRKHAAWYTQGLKGSSKFRGRMNEMTSYDDLVSLINESL